jgi:acetylornithine deacetylase
MSGTDLDLVDVVALTRALADLDSTTGKEAAAGRLLAQVLEARGYQVARQPVGDGRFNVFATLGADPQVVLSTHYDCVPPFYGSRVEGGVLVGRGVCDAKGILAAQVAAVERLRQRGETRAGLLFVVGEERGSDGAKVANLLAPAGVRFLINGEPTDNRLGIATRGILRVRLAASGRAAHSSFPELGESAIDKLLDALMVVRGLELAPVRAALAVVEGLVAVEHVLEVPAVRMHRVSGFETAVFPYTTDVPLLTNWGLPLLIGPGSIHVAHTDHEHVVIDELRHAVDIYEALTARLLAESVAASWVRPGQRR